MPQRALATGQSPDLPDHLIHLTARSGKESERLNPAIATQDRLTRLASILWTGWLGYGQPLDGGAFRVACFTQTTNRALHALLSAPEPRYTEPVGIAFHKQAVWDAGGAPVHYVRGEDWDAWQAADLPERVRALGVRYWPGWYGDPRPTRVSSTTTGNGRTPSGCTSVSGGSRKPAATRARVGVTHAPLCPTCSWRARTNARQSLASSLSGNALRIKGPWLG